MSNPGSSRVVDRLRSNLTECGIPFDDDDIAGIVERDFLRVVETVERVIERVPSDQSPDFVGCRTSSRDAPGSIVRAAAGDDDRAVPARRARAQSIAEVAPKIAEHEISPTELVSEALERIQEQDSTLNAFQLVLADEAMTVAREAEREILAGRYRGPLHGIPIAVKDLLVIAGTPTTAGSRVLADKISATDATVVARLRGAGAIIVGKTRLPEFAFSPASNNAHYGSTRNPRNPEFDTGGSSSGSAAAVAAGLVFAAIGSDTGGSIRIPAAFCGIVGLKPTFGRVSLSGVVPLSWSLDHLGPMTGTVEDAAIVLGAIAGFDVRDPRTSDEPVPDYVSQLLGPARKLRIGVVRDAGIDGPLGTPEVLRAWRLGLDALEEQGAELVELDLPDTHDFGMLNSGLISMEAAAGLQSALRERPDEFDPFMRQRVLTAFAYAPTAYVKAQQARAYLRGVFEPVFDRVDLLCTPTVPQTAPSLGVPAVDAWPTRPFNSLGWPSISVPVGLGANALPIGLQLVGPPWDEPTVLSAAAMVEAAFAGDR